MVNKVCKIVEKNVTKTSPQYYPEDNIKKEIGNTITVQRELPAWCKPADDKEGCDKAEEIHQAIPTDSERTKMK
jgi:hypothetical protein